MFTNLSTKIYLKNLPIKPIPNGPQGYYGLISKKIFPIQNYLALPYHFCYYQLSKKQPKGKKQLKFRNSQTYFGQIFHLGRKQQIIETP